MTTADVPNGRAAVRAAATRARAAAADLAVLTRARKDAALLAVADALEAGSDRVLAANAADVARAVAAGTDPAIVDRLTLTSERITRDRRRRARRRRAARSRRGRRPRLHAAQRAGGPAGAGAARRRRHRLRGPPQRHGRRRHPVPQERQRRAAAGIVVGPCGPTRRSSTSCERRWPGPTSRPTPSSSCPVTAHDAVTDLITARGLVDVVVPRGGAGLIERVVTESTVPVIETGVGNCHVYVDAAADVDMAVRILLDAKTAGQCLQRRGDPAGPCRHRRAVPPARDGGASGRRCHGPRRRADVAAAAAAGTPSMPVTDEDWAAEYYSLDIAAGRGRLVWATRWRTSGAGRPGTPRRS